jgi:UDP-glucose 4-epimerase
VVAVRILVTGLGTFWGSRLAQALEALDDVEVIVGLDTDEPRLPLERTEFVRADSDYSILQRIVKATRVDTILHTHLLVDSTEHSTRRMHEVNVIGTMNLLAAAGAAGSTVRKLIVKSSTLIYGAGKRDPYFFREEMERTTPPRTEVERSLLETSAFVRDFAVDNPHVIVTKLRFCNVLGDDISSPFSKALRLPIVPEIMGFDPRLQFVHEDDITRALVFATQNDIPGVFDVDGPGHDAVERGVPGRRQAAGAAAARAHELGRRAAAHGPGRRPAPRGARPPAVRPRRGHPGVPPRRVRVPVHDRGHRERVRPQPAPRGRRR